MQTIFNADILVIDDNEIDASILREYLQLYGCRVDMCDDLGFTELMENSYDLIFIDINMPSMDGFRLTETIRRSSLTIKNTPVIAITANKFTSAEEERSVEAGLNGFLEKPANAKVILRVLKDYLPHKAIDTSLLDENDLRLHGGFLGRYPIEE